MFGSFNWATDVLPQITSLWDNSMVKGPVIAIAAMSIVSIGASMLIGIFVRRNQ